MTVPYRHREEASGPPASPGFGVNSGRRSNLKIALIQADLLDNLEILLKIRVDGQFEGTIQTPGKVFVSKGGKLKAEVKAGHIALEGQVDGNLAAEDRVELRATSQLRGNVRAAKLLVVEGATFVGRCEVGPNVGAAVPKASADGPAMRPIPGVPAPRH